MGSAVASKGEMIVKMRNEFIRQAVEVEGREAAGKRVVTPVEERRFLGFNLRSRGPLCRGGRDGPPISAHNHMTEMDGDRTISPTEYMMSYIV